MSNIPLVRLVQLLAWLKQGRKRSIIIVISRSHQFIPVVIETSGAFGQGARGLIADIAHRIRSVAHEPKAHAYLVQRISVAIQQGNVAAVMGTAAASWGGT